MFRSAAAARLVQMPVATLRIWEQRYQAVRPRTAPSGHRLYTQADLERLQLLRALTQQGHAIGSLAPLGLEALQDLAGSLPPRAAAGTPSLPAVGAPLRLVVVGPALAARLARPAVARQLGAPVRLLAVHESLTEAARSALAGPCDLLVWHTPSLLPETPAELRAAQSALRARSVAAVYRFGSAAATAALASDRILLLREPPDDESLGAWLAPLQMHPSAAPAAPQPVPSVDTAPAPALPPARRYDDAQLTAIAGMSSTLACECPRHIAELLMLLSSFEAYSGSCQHRNPEDAALHAGLQQVAARSRALFEEALEQVARHEGLTLTSVGV